MKFGNIAGDLKKPVLSKVDNTYQTIDLNRGYRKENLVLGFAQLLRECWDESTKAVAPIGFKNDLDASLYGTHVLRGHGLQMNDGEEFLEEFLEELLEEFPRRFFSWLRCIVKYNNLVA